MNLINSYRKILVQVGKAVFVFCDFVRYWNILLSSEGFKTKKREKFVCITLKMTRTDRKIVNHRKFILCDNLLRENNTHNEASSFVALF